MQENINKIYTDALNKTASYLRLIGGNEAAISIVQKLIAKQLGVDRIAASCENKSG